MISLLALAIQIQHRPDVVVVVWDEVGWQDTNRIQTPNLDALEAEGVKFTLAYTHPRCEPSRHAFLCGSVAGYIHGNACDGVVPTNAIAPSTPTIADLFHALGYHTALFGKWHCGAIAGGPWETSPQRLGFENWRAGIPGNVGGGGCLNNGSYTHWQRVDDGIVTTESQWADESIRDEFINWWEMSAGSHRFAVVAFQSAHEPYSKPPGIPSPPNTSNQAYYKSQMQGLDLWLGDIMAVVGPETWVILFGDNGTPGCNPVTLNCANNATAAGQNPFRRKLSTYEGGVRVPFVVSSSDLPVRGVTCDAQVMPADIISTLAEGLCVPLPPLPGSVSFADCLLDPTDLGHRQNVFVFNPDVPDRAVIERQWKLRVDGFHGTFELFDLLNDPLELVNRYDDPAVAAEQARLEAALAAYP